MSSAVRCGGARWSRISRRDRAAAGSATARWRPEHYGFPMRQPWRIIQHSYIVEEVGLFSAGRHQRAAMPRRAHLTWALESSVSPLRGNV